jgi:5-formyltetrahydrofolate cyclo-ligase
MTDKNQWRAHFKKEWARLVIDQKSFEMQRRALLQNLKAFLKTQSGLWSAYRALPSEISIDEIPEEVTHLKWVYPKVVGHQVSGDGNPRLHFYGPGPRGFQAAYAGIHEPVNDQADEVPTKQIQGFLIPGLGFDEKGVRLGKGKGFFDRALAEASGIKVGVTFSAMVAKELPKELHDIEMDVVVTEKGVWTKWK